MGITKWGIKAGRAIGKDPNKKGDFGEMIVASIFDPRFFGDEEHYLVNNLIIETSDGITHQIDHVVIYKTGIFCIETKNIKGRIVGDNESEQWLNYRGNRQFFIYNPILQNRTHVKVLNAFLESNYDIQSVVVFTNSNKANGLYDYVLNLEDLRGYIKNYKPFKELSSAEMKEVFKTLNNYKESCGISKREHIAKIK